MFKKILFVCISLIFLNLVVISTNNAIANPDYELRDGDAFSGKNNYHSNGKYWISSSTLLHHRNAFSNAVARANVLSNADISLSYNEQNANIYMYSVNSSSITWYGQASYGTSNANLAINEYTCNRDGFDSSNYNKVALHELGHAYFMKHQAKEVNSVMKQGKWI